MGNRTILIIRHGPGRGRVRNYLQETLDALAAASPEVFERLRFHETGAAELPDLADTHAILFWLADPLRERYPSCFEEAAQIAEAARERGIRLLNPPQSLSHTIKSVQHRLWSEARIPTPDHQPFANRDELEAALEAVPFPVVLKADQLHGHEGMQICRTRADIDALVDDAIRYPGVVSPFVDTRAPAEENTVWSRYYHKKRVILFGDVIHARHAFFSDEPIVGLWNSTFRYYRKRYFHPVNRVLLWFRPWHRKSIRADCEFHHGPPEHPDVMRKAARALGLDVVAIDYSTKPDGSPVLWEANAHFWLPDPSNFLLPKERRFWERYDGFRNALADFLSGVLSS